MEKCIYRYVFMRHKEGGGEGSELKEVAIRETE